MSERTKEMIEKSLRLTLFVSAQRLCEAHKLSESGFQILSHGRIVTKTVAADKPRTARPAVAPYHNLYLLRDPEIGRERRARAGRPARAARKIVCADFGWRRRKWLSGRRLRAIHSRPVSFVRAIARILSSCRVAPASMYRCTQSANQCLRAKGRLPLARNIFWTD